MMTIRVLIADDHPLWCQSLTRLLVDDGRFAVVGTAATAGEALALVRRHDPALTLLDLRMPEARGPETIAAIRRANPTGRILVITAHAEPDLLHAVLDTGADGYMLKDDEPATLLSAAAAVVAQGRRPISPHLSHHLVPYFLDHYTSPTASDTASSLNAKERDVLRLTGQGKTAQQVGDTLGLSPRTIEDYRQRLRRKTGSNDLKQLAHQIGLV